MTNLQTKELPEGDDASELNLHEDIVSLQWDFLKHLFRVLNPSEEIEELKNYRAANDDII